MFLILQVFREWDIADELNRPIRKHDGGFYNRLSFFSAKLELAI
jgi:hypothetical protein